MTTDHSKHRSVSEPDAAPDPTASARAAVRPALPRRFYEKAEIGRQDDGWALTLDGRTARTPARRLLVVADQHLASALAREWGAQRPSIDPAAMPLTRLANVAIDRVSDVPGAVQDEIIAYAGSDLVCYRAGDPSRLVELQSSRWDPVLDWAREAMGARFHIAEGVMHVAQPSEALSAVTRRVRAVTDPLRLAALSLVTTLTGSALLALALEARAMSADEVWTAAHVDEDYQTTVWGEDEEASQRRLLRRLDFDAAALVLAAAT